MARSATDIDVYVFDWTASKNINSTHELWWDSWWLRLFVLADIVLLAIMPVFEEWETVAAALATAVVAYISVDPIAHDNSLEAFLGRFLYLAPAAIILYITVASYVGDRVLGGRDADL